MFSVRLLCRRPENRRLMKSSRADLRKERLSAPDVRSILKSQDSTGRLRPKERCPSQQPFRLGIHSRSVGTLQRNPGKFSH
jgi:hypothetical protein